MSISFLLWMLPTAVGLSLLLLVSVLARGWRHRLLLAEATIGLLLVGAAFLLTNPASLLFSLAIGLQAWDVLLASRLLLGRLPEPFLRASNHRNTLLMFGIYGVLLFAWWLLSGGIIQPGALIALSLAISCVVAAIAVGQTLWTLWHFRARGVAKHYALHELPTVTLAIPARNETHALDACLRAAIASTYPKLEIIVLDDCSQDATSEVIRSFAHDGVRFVQGEVPAEGWLGKNEAMRTLAEQATGEFILFCDVDTHLDQQSIMMLVGNMLDRGLDMLSVLPYRRDGANSATLLPSLRYVWQLWLPVTRRHVPVASQCWLVRRSTLGELGGFDAVRQKIVPEGYFARRIFAQNRYRIVVSDQTLGVTTAKRYSSQVESALRYIYPTLKRQPSIVCAAVLAGGAVLGLPFVILATVSSYDAVIGWLAGVSAGLFLLAYCLVVVRTHPRSWPVTLLLLPVSLVQELVMVIWSMIAYECGDVNWKGRNVCYPVIRQK